MPIVRYNDATIGFPDDMPPEEVQGVLGRAFSDFARDIDTAKTHLSRLAEGSVIVGAVRGMRPEDQAALATSFVPGVGDAAGLYADYTDIRENWDQVPWYDKAGMVGAAALGAVPFVPSRSQVNAGAEVAKEMMTPSRTGEIVEVFSGSNAPHPSEIEPYDERGPFNIFGGVFGSTRREVAEGHGDFIKKFDVDTGMMLEQRDLDNDEISVQLAKRLGISQDEASDVLTSVKRDEFSGDDAAQMLGMSDSGEASWEMQAKIGDAARKAGYDAVELPDEHGTSILVLNDGLPQTGRLETPEVPREKTIAYHGSPHDFPPVRELQMPDGARVYQSMDDAIPEGAKMLKEHPLGRFNMSKIGTGEGAQAYGHGLYFAEAEDVARGYRDGLVLQGAFFEDALLRSIDEFNTKDTAYLSQELANRLGRGEPTRDAVVNTLGPNRKVSADRLDEITVIAEKLTAKHGKGSMYQVEIDASPDEFLDWDLPLSQQSEAVRRIAADNNLERSSSGMKENTGAGLYQTLGQRNSGADFDSSSLRGADVNANPIFQDAGIKGIRYKDGFSRGADGGTSNYVVFDENLISIARKYGIAIPAAAAMLARQTGQNPQDLYEDDSGA